VTAIATVVEGKVAVRTEGGIFEVNLAKCKDVPGARWHAADRTWRYPLAVETCLRLREVWAEDLRVLPPLADWYRAARQEADAHVAALAATDADLPVLAQRAPALAEALDPPQRVGAAAVARTYRGGLLVADEPGSGKTLQLIAGIIEADVQGGILVACPRLSVKPVWHKELRLWAPDERVYIMRGTRAARQRSLDRFQADPAPRKWLVMVGECLRVKEAFKDDAAEKKSFAGYEYPGIFQKPWGAVIVDESHKAFGSLTVVKGTLWGKGLKRLETDRRYAVTGTPFGKGGRLQGMFGTLHWLWPDEFTSFWRWAETHFVIEEDEFYVKGGGGMRKTAKRVGELRGGQDGEAFLASLGPRILRRTKRETMPWLKDKEYYEVLCEMDPAQRKQYQALLDDGEFQAGEGVISADGVLAAITRAKQVASGKVQRQPDGRVVFDPFGSCKLDRLMERLETHGVLDGSSEMKVLVTSQFNELLHALEALLNKAKTPYHLMTGSTSDAKRDAMMATFQAPGGPQVFLLNAKAGGVSVTLDAADEVHMLDELWDPGDNVQVEDRIHRRSRGKDRDAARIYLYRTEGTIDTAIGETVEERRAAQHAVLDGRRGMDYVRQVVQYRPTKEEE
jgi:SNF2 family DNA or RNA helicase